MKATAVPLPSVIPTLPEIAAVPRHAINGFRKFAERTSLVLGAPSAFLAAVAAVIIWGVTGPIFHFSNRWQLVISTGTSVVTFLMVFLLQSTQTRDSRALHLKLDELLRSVQAARTGLVGLERLPDAHLAELADEFTRLGDQERGPDAAFPPVPDAPAE
jgi:low affinity Fe/Cu permease